MIYNTRVYGQQCHRFVDGVWCTREMEGSRYCMHSAERHERTEAQPLLIHANKEEKMRN